jgi:fibronectin type 3 domain-containing protein
MLRNAPGYDAGCWELNPPTSTRYVIEITNSDESMINDGERSEALTSMWL